MALSQNLGKDPVGSLVINLAVPAMIAQLVMVLYNVVDRIFIGRIPEVGELALAGVGVCGPIVAFLSSFGTLIGLGGSILMAMRLGEIKRQHAKQILANSFLLLVAISLGLTILFLLIKSPLISWFGASDATYPFANTYLTIYTLGTSFAVVALGLTFFINCQGFAILSMVTIVIGAVVNVILDALFILVFEWGVAGAAWATVIAQVCSCLFAVGFLCSKYSPTPISFRRYSYRLMGHIVKMGLPPFIILATDSLIFIALNACLQHFGGPIKGDQLIVCGIVAQSYLQLIIGPLLGLTGGTQAILSYNYGACAFDRIRETESWILFWAVAFTTCMTLVTPVIAPPFVAWFVTDPTLITMATRALYIFVIALIPLSIEYTFVDGLTALGRIRTALVLAGFRKSTFVIASFLFAAYFGAEYAFYGQPFADACATVVVGIAFVCVFERHLQARKDA